MRKYLLGFGVFVLAFLILSISVLRSASPRYAFSSPSPKPDQKEKPSQVDINYTLPYPGRILPDSPFWPAKALRDKLWYFFSINTSKRAELLLLYADKRLVMSQMLFERQKPELAFLTLTKGEKYLESAFEIEEKSRQKGENTTELLLKIANASLKHRQVIDEILTFSPEDAKPEIIKVQDYAKNIYQRASEILNAKGLSAPVNPFDGKN